MKIFNAIFWLPRNIRGAAVLRLLYGCDIPKEANIDNSVEFPHHALGVVIAPNVIIEKNVVIQHYVTLGMNRQGKSPVIREGAYVGAGAIVLGNVEIGRNATIGAGTIVTKTVPANGVYINPVELFDVGKAD